ncbi:hypothetical protein, partial [Streptomyces albidoflavus]|uniref:hypothetical protein n=1 Tax=Streptomyces albidoflavus TaxID=1886 RepID=UPI0021D6158A
VKIREIVISSRKNIKYGIFSVLSDLINISGKKSNPDMNRRISDKIFKTIAPIFFFLTVLFRRIA